MFAMDPGQVVGWVERGQFLPERARERILKWRNAAIGDEHDRPRRARHGLSETCKSEIENIDQVRFHDPRVLRRDAFAVVPQRGGGRLTWKLRQDDVVRVVGQGSADTERMFGRGVQMNVYFSNDGPVIAVAGGIESKSAEVQSAVRSERRIVANRKLVEH